MKYLNICFKALCLSTTLLVFLIKSSFANTPLDQLHRMTGSSDPKKISQYIVNKIKSGDLEPILFQTWMEYDQSPKYKNVLSELKEKLMQKPVISEIDVGMMKIVSHMFEYILKTGVVRTSQNCPSQQDQLTTTRGLDQSDESQEIR